jgi:hypothetical protein
MLLLETMDRPFQLELLMEAVVVLVAFQLLVQLVGMVGMVDCMVEVAAEVLEVKDLHLEQVEMVATE